MYLSTLISTVLLLCSMALGQTTDSIRDVRDGRIYKTVKIGNQWWMAQNLNAGTCFNPLDTMKDNGLIEKYVYNNNDACADTYGGLYQWDEMMQYSTTPGAEGICPAGWHIPTDTEWAILINAVGIIDTAGTALKQGGSSGFNALLAGYCYRGSFSDLGRFTSFWCSTQHTATSYAMVRYIDVGWTSIGHSFDLKTFGLCVRCLKNDTTPVKIPSTHNTKILNGNGKEVLYDIFGRKVQLGTSSSGIYILKNSNDNAVKKVLIIK